MAADGPMMLPRWPTNIFYNTINPDQLVDEYNYIFHDRFVNAGQDPCQIPGAICATRTYPEILLAEADAAIRHIVTFNRWPHFSIRRTLPRYDASGNTLQFDWLNAVFTEYERMFKLADQEFSLLPDWDRTADTSQFTSLQRSRPSGIARPIR